jgi:hypothetical protein
MNSESEIDDSIKSFPQIQNIYKLITEQQEKHKELQSEITQCKASIQHFKQQNESMQVLIQAINQYNSNLLTRSFRTDGAFLDEEG